MKYTIDEQIMDLLQDKLDYQESIEQEEKDLFRIQRDIEKDKKHLAEIDERIKKLQELKENDL